MKLKLREALHSACCAGVAINTVMFAFNIINQHEQFAYFNILCALGCWVGIFNFGRQDADE